MTLDLRTGLARPHRRKDYNTKIAAVAADERVPIPLWTEFLDTVTNKDKELQRYLQRVSGYCMTGVTIEHVLFFLYGTGANGKGVFLNTLRGIWGDYAVVASMETFIETKYPQHSTDLAMLAGARLVIAQEVEKNKAWAEAKINSLTGGDPITARYMRQDFFHLCAEIQADDRGQPQTVTAQCQRSGAAAAPVDPVRRDDPAREARQGPPREAQARVARYPQLGAAGLPRMAADRARAAQGRDGRERSLLRRGGRDRPLDRGMLRRRQGLLGDERRAIPGRGRNGPRTAARNPAATRPFPMPSKRVAISARSSATALAFTASRSDRTSGTTMHQLRHRTGRSAENPKSSISAICGGCGGFSFIDRQYACTRVWERLSDRTLPSFERKPLR